MRRFSKAVAATILILAVAGHVGAAVNLPPPLPPDVAPQWLPAPGVPEVAFAPNIPGNLFFFRGRYFYSFQGQWYRGRTPWGPWHVARRLPPALRGLPPTVFK